MPPAIDPLIRFFRHVDKTDGCWLWTGGGDRKGYGRFRRGRRGQGMSSAPRWIYERLVGPLAESEQIDHICNEPRCVRPDHLQKTTNLGNQRLKWARKEACLHGHPWDVHNTRHKNGNRYTRVCRACHRRRETERRERKRASVNV